MTAHARTWTACSRGAHESVRYGPGGGILLCDRERLRVRDRPDAGGRRGIQRHEGRVDASADQYRVVRDVDGCRGLTFSVKDAMVPGEDRRPEAARGNPEKIVRAEIDPAGVHGDRADPEGGADQKGPPCVARGSKDKTLGAANARRAGRDEDGRGVLPGVVESASSKEDDTPPRCVVDQGMDSPPRRAGCRRVLYPYSSVPLPGVVEGCDCPSS